MKTPILGSTYVTRSINAANARMVNLFPEIIPEGGKEPAFLNRAPGLNYLANVGSDPVRGLWVAGDTLYVVCGSILFKINSSFGSTGIGTVSNLSGAPVSFAYNGFQLMIVSDTLGYIYDTNTSVFVQISSIYYPGALSVVSLDGWFFVNKPNSQEVWVSASLDGLTWDAAGFRAATASMDNTVGMIADHGELWIFGENSTEVWYNASANPDFPYAPISGAFMEVGCASAATIAKMDNAVFWLTLDDRGVGMVYRSHGYNGERVSTHAIEWQIQQYGDLSTALAYTYQQDGHSFYVLIFPGQNTSWVYDASTQSWHERCGFDNGDFTRHRSNCQAFYNNQVVVGDYQNGNLYTFNLDVYADNGEIQKWLRSWRALPQGQNNLKRTANHSLQLDCESGVGLNAGQGSDPQVMLRWSDDAGHTWSNEHWVSIGKIGVYWMRAIWRRLGMTMKLRDRVYEVSGTDPVKIAIMGAELIMDPTNA